MSHDLERLFNVLYVKSVQIRSFSGAYFPVFRQNTGKYGPGKTPYLDNFHAVFPLFVYLFHVTFGIFV